LDAEFRGSERPVGQVIVQDDGQPSNIKSSLPGEYIATKVPDLVDDVYIAGVEGKFDGRGKVLG
jgi:hypothetical protein